MGLKNIRIPRKSQFVIRLFSPCCDGDFANDLLAKHIHWHPGIFFRRAAALEIAEHGINVAKVLIGGQQAISHVFFIPGEAAVAFDIRITAADDL